MGGDEFAALVSGLSEKTLRDLLSRIIEAIARPIGTPSQTVTASAGASWLRYAASDDDEASVDLTFRAADLALYRAKGLGRNRFAIDDERFESATDIARSRANIHG